MVKYLVKKGYRFEKKYGPFEIELDRRVGDSWVALDRLEPGAIQPSLPDVGLSVSKMKSEHLSVEQAKQLLQLELADRNRSGMVRLLRGIINGAQN